MRHELTVHRAGAPPEKQVISVATTAGGSRADGVVVPGAPPAAALLLPVPAGVVVEAGAPGIRVAEHAVAPGNRRLLRPGERAEIHGTALALERPPPPDGATRAAAAALLRDAAAGAAAIAGPRLVVLNGPAAGERHPLAAEQTVGRGRSATIRIADPHASRVHARVRVGPGGATIEDLRSKNGVRMNGVRIERRTSPLRPGDEVAVGDTLLALEDPAPPSPAPGPLGPAPAPGRRSGPRGRPAAHAAAAALLALSAVALAIAAS